VAVVFWPGRLHLAFSSAFFRTVAALGGGWAGGGHGAGASGSVVGIRAAEVLLCAQPGDDVAGLAAAPTDIAAIRADVEFVRLGRATAEGAGSGVELAAAAQVIFIGYFLDYALGIHFRPGCTLSVF